MRRVDHPLGKSTRKLGQVPRTQQPQTTASPPLATTAKERTSTTLGSNTSLVLGGQTAQAAALDPSQASALATKLLNPKSQIQKPWSARQRSHSPKIQIQMTEPARKTTQRIAATATRPLIQTPRSQRPNRGKR